MNQPAPPQLLCHKTPSDPNIHPGFKGLVTELLSSDLIEGPAGLSLLDSLQSCVESFFLGLRVKCLPSIPVSSIHCCFRHSRDSDRVQLHTGEQGLAPGSPQGHQPGHQLSLRKCLTQPFIASAGRG